jgi:hypothetical protein
MDKANQIVQLVITAILQQSLLGSIPTLFGGFFRPK